MNFKFLFKENIADQRLMQLERVWEQNPWSPAANGNEVVEGATAGGPTAGNTTGNAAGTTTSTATTGATAGTQQPVNPFQFNGKAIDFTYNKDLSARQNRKLLKKKIKSMGGDKADATGMISEYWAQNGGASGSDKKWLDARASQYGYTTDANGNRDYHRKPGNWGKALATIGGALLGGPVGGAAAYMWADQKSQIPGLKKGFFDPTSVKSAAKTQPVTEQPVVEQPAVEQPVTGFDPSKGVTFSGFSGDWGKRAQQVYDNNKNAEVWRTIAGDDNEITQDEFMAWQRANKVDGGVDGKLGRHSLVALGFGSQQDDYSWMNPRDQGGDDIKTSMDDVVITPELSNNSFNQHMSGLGYTPIILENGSIAFKDKTGKVFFNNGRMRVNGKMSNYDYTSLGKAGDIYYTADGGKRYSYKNGKLTPISEQDSSGWVNGGAIKEMQDFRNALDFNSETVNFGGKTFKNPYYLNNVFRTTNNAPDQNQSGQGEGAQVRVNGVNGTLPVRVWNDRSFAIDTQNGKAYELEEDWFGEVDGRNETPINTYNLYSFFDNFDSNRQKKFRYEKQGGVLRFQYGGQLDDQDKMLLASTLGMIGYAASQGKQMQIEEAAAQVASLAQSQPESLQELASNKELVNAGVQAVGQETVQKLSQPGVMKQLLTQVSKMPKAMNGTKLNYIKELKGICPEGYEMQYFATGGNLLCPRCMKSKKIEEAKCGKKMKKKHESGGVSKMMNSIKTSMKK